MATAQTLPPIETKFSFKGLKEAQDALTQLRTRTASAFTSIRNASNLRLEPLRRDLETVGKAAKPAFATISTGAKAATASVTGLAKAASAAAKATSVVGRASAGIGGLAAKGVGGAALGGIAAFAGLKKASDYTADFVQSQQKFARAAGTSVQKFQELSFAARRYGAEDQDLVGGLSSLSDKIKDASQGGQSAQLFSALGIPTKDDVGRLRDSSDVLVDLIDKTKSLGSTQRAGIFNELLGGDAQKLSLLLASSKSDISALGQQAGKFYVTSTPQQQQAVDRFNKSLFEQREAFRGLALDVGTRFLPPFTSLMDRTTSFVVANRVKFGTALANFADNYIISPANDILKIFKGEDDYVQNRWLLSARDRLAGLKIWLGQALVFVEEFYYTISGQDQKVQVFPWLIPVRDQVLTTLQSIVIAFGDAFAAIVVSAINLYRPVAAAFAAIGEAAESAWSLIVGGSSGTATSPFIASIAVQILFVRDLIISLYQLLSGQAISDPKFEVLETFSAALVKFAADVATVFGWFQQIFGTVEQAFSGLFKFFGVDLTQLVLFGALSRFILKFGLLGDAIKLVIGIWKGGAWLAEAVGLIEGGGAVAGAASAAGGAIGVVTSLGGALSTVATTAGVLAAALAPAAPLIVAAVGIIGAAGALAKAAVDKANARYDAEIEASAAQIRAAGPGHPWVQVEVDADRQRKKALSEQDQNQAAADAAVGRYTSPLSTPTATRFDTDFVQPVNKFEYGTSMRLESYKHDPDLPDPSVLAAYGVKPQPSPTQAPVNLTLVQGGPSYALQGDDSVVKQLQQEIQKIERQQLSALPKWQRS